MDVCKKISGGMVMIHCPGCGYGHAFGVEPPAKTIWTWNGSTEKPTFSPSMLVNSHDAASRCHSFVTDGKIRFLADCFHDMKNQTVPLGTWDPDPPIGG